ncbi:hypothetical protein P22_2450 [Propionispora sp. 2/2-37]|uniref:hypothetical protein n=1 Tax=Propionispora sp. 2/2-37 TaxID=1677858 RepID=UPI0006BB66D9|nr:hypothetical protein [Propionispora sp. 2/2-37]CUH96360.1 hypothetical protein P22_2450 [Propionispora sp. 2/2-37]
MPRCLDCGNTKSFVSSVVSPASQYANGPLSGLIADFADETLQQVTSLGADKKTINAANAKPQEFFDTCFYCGSQQISWEKDLP